ncbi:MAG TPA: hypothetical protein VHB77_06180, partial [Planctomycetaceae bacterium]|nr:hypothetical protein [Planctomycetaceae bacterium]
MPAKVSLKWQKITFRAQGISGWVAFKRAAGLKKGDFILSDRAVYVIRTQRPFSFNYGDRHSPVAYIGKGQFQQRITAHLKSWIKHLSKNFPELKIDIYFCEPKVRYHGPNCEGVEADLIEIFRKRYGARPL